MSRVEWIVCERSGRWAAALRVALRRSSWLTSAVPRLYEVRQLGEMTERLDTRPDAIALVEVQPTSLGDVLDWLTRSRRELRQAHFAALLDRSAALHPRDRKSVIDVLREAGAAEVITSPRQLAAVLALGQRHAALRAVESGRLMPGMSMAEWAWSSLPWQRE